MTFVRSTTGKARMFEYHTEIRGGVCSERGGKRKGHKHEAGRRGRLNTHHRWRNHVLLWPAPSVSAIKLQPTRQQTNTNSGRPRASNIINKEPTINLSRNLSQNGGGLVEKRPPSIIRIDYIRAVYTVFGNCYINDCLPTRV